MNVNDELRKRREYGPGVDDWLSASARAALARVFEPSEERVMEAAVYQVEAGLPRLRDVYISYPDMAHLVRRLSAKLTVENQGTEQERVFVDVLTVAGAVRIWADADAPSDVITPGPHKDWMLYADRSSLTREQLEIRYEHEIERAEALMKQAELTRLERKSR